MDNRKLKKQREAAAKLSRPRPVELPSGKWRCQVMVDGKRFDVIEDDPATAHAKALAVKAGLLEREKSSTKDLTVGEAIDRYIESKDAVLSPSTVMGYKKVRKNALQGIMDIKLRDITQEDVQREINRMSRDKSPKYVRNAHGLLSAALSVYRPSMVLRTTMPQKQKKEIIIPTAEEVRLIAMAAKGSRFELPFLLAAWMGLRTSEIRGLTWDCIEGEYLHIKQALVDGENGPELKKTKTYSGDRKIKIPGYIMELFEKQNRTNRYILQIHRGQLYDTLNRYCKRCGIRHYRFHDLRHYQASVMLALGIPDKYAMERMGHSSTNMLKNVYQHTILSKEEEVAIQVDNYFEKNLHTVLHTNK